MLMSHPTTRLAGAIACALAAGSVNAADLRNFVSDLYGGNGIELSAVTPVQGAANHVPHFTDESLEAFNLLNTAIASSSGTFAFNCILARRLAEAGCGFIPVNPEFVWDFHADNNNIGVDAGRKAVAAPFDHAVSAFIEDCEARGLGEKILLVCCGEMGRTPKINKNGGRDHWPALAPLILYGGGLTHGQVIGQSSRDGGSPEGDSNKPDNLLATIFRQLFDYGQLRLVTGLPNEIKQAAAKMNETPGVV